ncbi:MAG: LemA family protein [Candidatus Micrarchaeaceae archaeon]
MSIALMILLSIIGVIILGIAIWIIVIYNGFVSKRNRVKNAWAQIDVQLKRRYDLIPNLVETVQSYAKYERGVLEEVTKLRESIMTGSVANRSNANNQLSTALKSLFAVAENYPDLKASDNFKSLQEQLADTEDKIAFVRTSYNDYVMDYNNALQEFPGNIFAPRFGFKKADFYATASEKERQPVKVDFSGLNGGDDNSTTQQQQTAPKS